jgi:DNA invertase Pin-like site-specific DNA recombinase
MAIYGYVGVPATDQDLTLQEDALNKAGCETIRAEKISEVYVEERQELDALLEILREGDTLVVTRVDRLTRSILGLQNMVHDLKNKGVSLKALSGAGGF